jgi:septal ring factor EnvC (AmiA/AmiB activator)
MRALSSILLLALSSQPMRGKLKAVGEQLEQERIDVERLLSQEGPLLQVIDAAARDETAAEQALREAQRRSAEVADRLGAARSREQAAQAAADQRLVHVKPRLRVWQRLSSGRRAELLLSAGSAQQAERREDGLRQILQQDLSEMRGVLRDLRAAKEERTVVAGLEADLMRKRAEDQAAEQEAGARRAHHAALLEAVREERGLHERAARELKTAQERLSEVVSNLPAERIASTQFAAARGSLPAPVDGRIEQGFGPILNARFHTVTLQKGLDFKAEEGTPVRAVHKGRVVQAGPFPGYGNLLIVDHGDGYFTLFAHLAVIRPAVDDVVETGDEIGQVGDTGSLKGPYLHFEIRHHGEALDPSDWLGPAPAPAPAP